MDEINQICTDFIKHVLMRSNIFEFNQMNKNVKFL